MPLLNVDLTDAEFEKALETARGTPLSKDAQRAVGGARADHVAAYRRRMGMVGVLQSCVCCWPNELEPTSTGHHWACPAHNMLTRKRT